MKKIIVISLVLFNISMSATGTLDSSFGTGGRVTTSFGGSNDQAEATVFQPDGKIVAAGHSNASGDFEFALARYNADGSLDSSFGTNGLVTTSFGGTDNRVKSVVLQPDGKIVAVGFTNASGDFDFALARYGADGSLDSSFGTNGLVTTSFGGTDNRAVSVVRQPDGKMVVAGRSNASGSIDFALARYNADGSLDSSFGTNGLVTTSFGGTDNRARSVVLQPDGKIVAAGHSNASGSNDFALARYNTDGSLDSSFGINGLVTTNFGGNDQAVAAVLQPDGKIVVAGHSNASGTFDFALARYNANGSLDSSFGINGLVSTRFGVGANNRERSVVLQPDGKIVMVGRVLNASGDNDFALARYNADGSLDTSFGTNGLLITSFGIGSNDQGLSAVLQADGRIIVAGTSNLSSTFDFALARYLIPSITISQLARDLRAKYFLLQ